MNKKFQREIESATEYVLPDYLGDVKKLLSSSAVAVPAGSFGGDKTLEVSGIVQYEIVYLDSENKLSAASFSSDYDAVIDVAEEFSSSYSRASVSSFSMRLTGPRRMSVKANVGIDASVSVDDDFTVSGTAFDGEYVPQLRRKTIKTERMLCSEAQEREFAEETAKIEGVSADEIELLTSGALIRISDTEAVDGGVTVRGVLSIYAIIRVNSEPPFSIKQEVPFEETVTIEGSDSEASAIADAYVSSVACNVNDSEGCAVIVANVIADISAVAFKNEELEIVADSYLCERDTAEKYEKIKHTEHLHSSKSEVSAVLRLPLSDCVGEGFAEFLSLNLTFKNSCLKITDNGCEIVADAQFSGIACEINSEGERIISPAKFASPITFSVNKNCHLCEEQCVFVKLSPTYADWSIDGGELILKCKTDARIQSSLECGTERLVASELVGEARYESSISKIRVYYPDAEESLYSVAKKFHTTVEAISLDNELSESVSSAECAKNLPRLIIS